MKCKVFTLSLLLVFLISGATILNAQEKAEADTTQIKETAPAEDSAAVDVPESVPDKFIAYYFHGTRRCATCKKLEAYSTEAVQTGFPDQLKSGALEWQVVNIDEEENEHFVKDYQLYTKSVIVSHIVDGKEAEWKNLDKIWELVGDKDKFIEYVRSEMTDVMGEN